MRYKSLLFILFSIFLASAPIVVCAQKGDSITVAIAPEYDSVTSIHRILFGESYRKLWAAPVRVRTIHFNTEKGGLKILEKGGGLQTKSLKLKDASGKEWSLRSIQKYPDRALPKKLKATIAKDILQDQVSTGHPFSALTVPPFAAALGILHSNPEVVYVGNDAALGKYRSDFANSVLLLEERDPASSIDTDNSEKVEEKLQKDNENRVDQKMVLRARLLDLFLGDWDRHEGQWRWDQKKVGNGDLYSPVPRDRDKVFYNTSGLFPTFLSHQSLKSNLQGFHKDVRDIAGYNFNNRYFDRIFLNAMSESDWEQQISFVLSTLTDSLILSAVHRMPPPIFALSGNKIINTLKARKLMLRKEALKYYRFISLRVDVPASDKPEIFKVENRNDGDVAVTIYKVNKSGKPGNAFYNRVFDHKITKEVRLYGFEGRDIFTVTGTEKTPIKIRMIGGGDRDSFYVDANIHNKRKLYIYDRADEKNMYPKGSLVRIKTSTDSAANSYDHHNFKYDKLGPVFSLLYSGDQGLTLRAGLNYEKHGFRKEPFAEKHLFAANYSKEYGSFMFEYSGYLTKAFYNNDVDIELLSRGPKNVSNFFGLGNETQFVNKGGKDINYYRNRFDIVTADIRLRRALTNVVSVNGGLLGTFYTSSPSSNTNHFFKDFNADHATENIYDNRYYAGLVAGASVDTRNDGLTSNSGFLWEAEIKGLNQLDGKKERVGQIFSELNVYIPVLKDSNVVIANRIGGGTTFGSPAFFQQMQLGGVRNLRGFHNFRFTGKSMFYHNLDVRCKLFDFTSYLFPGTVGVIGFNDIGRVWVPNENSNKWHHGYGGGIYIIPADLVLIQALVARSVEGTMPYISIGFSF